MTSKYILCKCILVIAYYSEDNILLCSCDHMLDDLPSSIISNYFAEVLGLVFDILEQEIDPKVMDQYRGLEIIMKKSLKLLKALARGNDVVQSRMFERLDPLLKIKVVEPEMAIALKEVTDLIDLRKADYFIKCMHITNLQ